MTRRRCKILVVDSDAAALARTTGVLRDARYHVIAASTFEEAKRHLETALPDLLIADVQLGLHNGLHLILRSRAVRPELPAIVTHAVRDPVLEREAAQLSAAYLVKPLDPVGLLKTVGDRFGESRATRERRHWLRKATAPGLDVQIGATPARLIDLSYGGLGFQLVENRTVALSPSFDVALPHFKFTARATLVWASRCAPARGWCCGAELAGLGYELARTWRTLIDGVS